MDVDVEAPLYAHQTEQLAMETTHHGKSLVSFAASVGLVAYWRLAR